MVAIKHVLLMLAIVFFVEHAYGHRHRFHINGKKIRHAFEKVVRTPKKNQNTAARP